MEGPTVGTKNEATRLAWVEQALRQIPAGSRLLDAGAGEGRFKPLCAHLKYVAQDVAQYDGKGDAAGLHTGTWDFSGLDLVCDISSIPEPDASFDAILCTEVFEHLPNPIDAIKEFARLLRPGGTLLVTAPFASLTHFAPYHFATGFNRYFYETHFPAHGLTVVELTPNGNFFEFLAQEFRRLKSVGPRYTGDSSSSSSSPPADFEQRLAEARNLVLPLLQECSAVDTGSAELLCFGFHVRAIRQ